MMEEFLILVLCIHFSIMMQGFGLHGRLSTNPCYRGLGLSQVSQTMPRSSFKSSVQVTNIQSMLFNFFPSSGKDKKENYVASLKDEIKTLSDLTKPNGLVASPEQKIEMLTIVGQLEQYNPTKNPAYSELMNGFWRMLYTDFDPPSTSAGKLGPFVGDVFQDLNSKEQRITNILDVKFPSIKGGLVAKQSIYDKNTWKIEFEKVGNTIFGIKFPAKMFKPGDQIRLWEITYLDEDLRILRARRPEVGRESSFVFILSRDEPSRFSVDI